MLDSIYGSQFCLLIFKIQSSMQYLLPLYDSFNRVRPMSSKYTGKQHITEKLNMNMSYDKYKVFYSWKTLMQF